MLEKDKAENELCSDDPNTFPGIQTTRVATEFSWKPHHPNLSENPR